MRGGARRCATAIRFLCGPATGPTGSATATVADGTGCDMTEWRPVQDPATTPPGAGQAAGAPYQAAPGSGTATPGAATPGAATSGAAAPGAGAPGAGLPGGSSSAAFAAPGGPRDRAGIIVFLAGIAAGIPTLLISMILMRAILSPMGPAGDIGGRSMLASLLPLSMALLVTAILIVGIWLMRTPVAARAWATGAVVGALVWSIAASFLVSFSLSLVLRDGGFETYRMLYLLFMSGVAVVEVSLITGAWVLARRYRPILLLGAVVVAIVAMVCSTAVSFATLGVAPMSDSIVLGLLPTVVSVTVQLLGIGALALLARRIRR